LAQRRTVMVVGILLAQAASIAHADINSFNPLAWLLAPKDATNYATRMATTVQDRPECQKFKQEIMSYAKGSPADGKTTYPMALAKQKATNAGCAK